MELQGRNLSLRMRGEDVERLKEELQKLGFSIEAGETGFGRTTRQAVLEFQRNHGLEATGVVDEATATAINADVDALEREEEPDERPEPFVVRGQVRQTDGSLLVGVVVKAFDKDLRSEELLGEATTDQDGRYEVTYTADQFTRAEKGSADLTFQVLNREGLPLDKLKILRILDKQRVLVEAPPIIFNSRPQEEVILTIGDGEFRGPSEYEQYIVEITPLLQGVPFDELTEDERHQDITFLTGETGINPLHIAFLVIAHRLGRQTDLSPEVFPEVFYGLFRQGLPTRLPALLLQSPRALRRALEASDRDNIINLNGNVDTILETVQGLIGKHVIQATDEEGSFLLGDLLRTSALSEDLQEKFLKLYVNHEGHIEDFWEALRKNPDFQGAGVVEDLQFTLQLGLLTQNNIPLVKALKGLHQQGTRPLLRDFAKLDANALKELINSVDGAADGIPSHVPGETKEEKVENYVSGIIETLIATFPTTFVGMGITKALEIDLALVRQVLAQNSNIDPSEPLPDNLNWGGISEDDQARAKTSMEAIRQEIKMFPQFDYKSVLADVTAPAVLSNPVRKGVSQFFENEPDFEFSNTHIDTYLAEHAETAFNGIPEQDRAAVTSQLKSIQRVFRVAPRYEHMQALMSDGLDSAYAISSIPQSAFVQIFSDKMGGDMQTIAYYSQAQQTTATNKNVYAGVHQAVYDVTPLVIGGPSDAAKNAIKQMPNWTTLFGRIDLCDCEHCRSVFSPAAYFVDLLQFLNPKSWNYKLGAKRPFEVLLERRPDLEHIKLTCGNTNTPLPYADLVNEILEYYVAHGELDEGAAKNTEDITAEELSVNPQYTIEAAYDKLKKRVYPLTLPFNRSLEIARAYMEHVGSSRYHVMDTFQKGDEPSDLEIACESLKISTRERQILTGVTPPLEPFTPLHAYYGYKPPAVGWEEDIARVTEFLKRTGISYVDLIELMKTRFLNANKTMTLVPIVSDSDPNELIDLCDLSKIKINNLDSAALGKIYRFIRLWRKFGWQIRDLDKVMAALGVTDLPDNILEQRLVLEKLLQNMALTKHLQEDLKQPLVPLLSLWADIDTDGRDSFYIKLFQNKAVLNPMDSAFELRYGAPLDSLPNVTFPDLVKDKISYDAAAKKLWFIGGMSTDERMLLLSLSSDADYQLAIDSLFQMRWSDGTELAIVSAKPDEAQISKHASAILAALRVNADDLTVLRGTTGLSDEAAPLTLENLSLLYRHALLTKALKLKAKDLVALKVLTGIDPFQPAAPAPTVEFVEKSRKVKQSGFSVTQLNYLYRHFSDPTKSTTPSQEQLVLLAKQLDDDLKAIADDNVLAPDPTGDLTRKKLGTIWESTIVEQMISMLDGTAKYSTPLDNLSVSTFPDPIKGKISYDTAAKMLRFTGPMTPDEQTILLGLSADAGYQNAINNLFQQPRDFLFNTKAGFLNLAEAVAQLLDTASLTTQEKFDYILTHLLPYLRDLLSRSLVKQTLSDALKLDGAMTELLLEKLLKSPTNTNQLAIEDFLALLESGLTGEYFSDPQLATPLPSLPSRIDAAIAFNGKGTTDTTTIPAGTGSARWTGMMLAPNNGDYTFYINASGSVQLWVGDDLQPIQLQLDPETNELVSPPITLKAGQLYSLRLEALNLQVPQGASSAIAELRWSSNSTPKDIVPQSNLYPASTFAAFVSAFTLLHKVALLVNTFKMTGKEVAYLSKHDTDFAEFNLNILPLDPIEFTVDLFKQWERLYDLFTLRDGLAQGEVGLINVFETASASADPNTLSEAVINTLIEATGWDATELGHLTGTDGFNLADADFQNEIWLLRLQACVKSNRQLGVSAKKLFEWATVEPDANQAKDIIKTVKAKYDEEQWLTVGKPLNDGLRESQKAALIAYVLADEDIIKLGIADSNQLFEYFLIDVEMSACMMTSRIKQAISSVQLFIQRCLMNLEPKVSPAAIGDEQWNWMKNYRVWEANRKVFLYPENWIEPELRDNKSPFFKELESELLQNDVTMDTAEQVFLNYLKKLDDVARLEVVGMYHQLEYEGQVQARGEKPIVNILHVFGRTFNPPHIYYYRRLNVAKGFWTPWEKVNLDIESDQLIPVVYNRRLYLFWLHFGEKQNTKQELPAAYIQSIEHWKWANEEIKQWETDHEKWREDHNLWQRAQDIWNSWQALVRNLPGLTQEQEDDMINSSEPAFIDRYPALDDIEPPEPQRPEEPPFSTPPPLTHWEIKLVWSEYTKGKNEYVQGKWSPKQTSLESVVSPFVSKTFQEYATQLGAFYEAFVDSNIIQKKSDGTPEETIFSVHLPSKESHFLRTEISKSSGDLVLKVYRRYRHSELILDQVDLNIIEVYNYLGYFRLECGAKVKAVSQLQLKDFESLPRPDDTTNLAMSFQHEQGPQKLSFTSDGETLDILRNIPEEASHYNLLYEHQYSPFALKPPFEDFFYQDLQKTYFVSFKYDNPWKSWISLASAAINISYTTDAPLVATYKKRASLAIQPKSSLIYFGSGGLQQTAVRSGAMATLEEIDTDITPIASTVNQAGFASPAWYLQAFTGIGQLVINYSLFVQAAEPYLRFETFFHPHVCRFIGALYRSGVSGLLARSLQQMDNDKNSSKKNVFVERYNPSSLVHPQHPSENVDFGNGAYSLYNWELFFHASMLIAVHLSQNQRFEEAQEWFHYIFDPTDSSKEDSPQRYWKVLPFYNNAHPENQQIKTLLTLLSIKDSDLNQEQKKDKQAMKQQVAEWRDNPFNPHLIARLRITAYQKNVVMKYIDNLIAWGDQLFSRDTIESINEATMLYVLAANMLGPRPELIPASGTVKPETYFSLKKKQLDEFSNVLVQMETEFPLSISDSSSNGGSSGTNGLNLGTTFYFCIPQNDKLLGYWDTVADRLFKIRHCMNIEGVVRQLPLFEPPIDPALLVKAFSMGIDISSILNDMSAPVPHYRFNYMLQKALELCSELKSLGGTLLSALEKRDAEELALLRSSHEIKLLDRIREVKVKQIDEANEALEGLKKAKIVTEARRNYYRDIVRISANEQLHMDSLGAAHDFNQIAQGLSAGVSVAHMMPEAIIGSAGFSSPYTVAKWGGGNVGHALTAAAAVLSMIAAQYTHDATMASIEGGYERRWDDWKLQEKLANKELDQIDTQIAAAEIRVAITEKELENHDKQIEDSVAAEEFMRGKYTNQELYTWMVGEILKTFFQSHKLAYDIAKRAERAYRFELGLTDSNFIQFGYWDNLRKGLLSGERLYLDLKRLEMAYLDKHKREYEITKHISLVLHDPMALIALKEMGQCEVFLPEALFDVDYPGHYMRRIKSVSLTIPCVTGPYTSINCTLTLLNNKTRIDSNAQVDYLEQEEDTRFVTNFAALQSIATSHAQNDSGMFELNFRDERYLPFEGAGVISRWRIDMPKYSNAFDFNTITDVVIRLNYTAREGGDLLRKKARDAAVLPPMPPQKATGEVFAPPEQENLIRLFSAKHEFPSEWHRLLHPKEADDPQTTLELNLTQERFPFQFRGRVITIDPVELFLKLKDGVNLEKDKTYTEIYAEGNPLTVSLASPDGTDTKPLESIASFLSGIPHAVMGVSSVVGDDSDIWTLTAQKADIIQLVTTLGKPDAIEDIIIVCHYSVTG